MRPINLMPEEERRRSSGVDTRTGPVAYLLVGALGVLLIGVVMLVLFNNSISDHQGEVARLETEKAAVTAQAAKLTPYTDFKRVSEDRTRTVAELADARFDWVRVLRQLSLVLPGDVYFRGLVASGGGGEGGVAGPSLSIGGCADGQKAVGGFIASLRAINGVTRVELTKSTLNKEGEGESAGGDVDPCSKPGVAQFEALVAFDSAPPSPDSSGSTVGESTESTASESAEEGSEEESSEGESSEAESSESSESSSQSATATTGAATG